MTDSDEVPNPLERLEDFPRIQRALARAVRDAVMRHKRLGNPIAAWRDGQVVWIQPEDIPEWAEDALEPGG